MAVSRNKLADAAILEVDSPGSDTAVVDPARVEQQIDEKLIGERIRAMRLRRSMGLVELGRLTRTLRQLPLAA